MFRSYGRSSDAIAVLFCHGGFLHCCPFRVVRWRASLFYSPASRRPALLLFFVFFSGDALSVIPTALFDGGRCNSIRPRLTDCRSDFSVSPRKNIVVFALVVFVDVVYRFTPADLSSPPASRLTYVCLYISRNGSHGVKYVC